MSSLGGETCTEQHSSVDSADKTFAVQASQDGINCTKIYILVKILLSNLYTVIVCIDLFKKKMTLPSCTTEIKSK